MCRLWRFGKLASVDEREKRKTAFSFFQKITLEACGEKRAVERERKKEKKKITFFFFLENNLGRKKICAFFLSLAPLVFSTFTKRNMSLSSQLAATMNSASKAASAAANNKAATPAVPPAAPTIPPSAVSARPPSLPSPPRSGAAAAAIASPRNGR